MPSAAILLFFSNAMNTFYVDVRDLSPEELA
jgi:hypothetical protein